ncbi:MAG: RidA family protein [Planctomycetes bacterium]|nr:RidA family protein [Planctomycetota bacterium]
MKHDDHTRRSFLTRASAGGAAVAAVGGCAALASAADDAKGRRVIGGSPLAAFSRAVAFDRLVFVSGVVGNKPGTLEMASPEFEAQCRQALENLKDSVEAAGSTMDRVLKCTCFLVDAGDFAAFNKVYRGYFPSDPPARSTVAVRAIVIPGAKLEIDCVTCLE